ncbi:MAG: ATP-binding cassette domain-containing protein [Chloroflexales bacterium]|nr:ATP-binding cassette domain-containing protein [Chloroflexales bacterium]
MIQAELGAAPSQTDAMLHVRNLSRVYGRGCTTCLTVGALPPDSNVCQRCSAVIAVNNISFDLGQGEVLGIMGESGSGKSTLVRLLYFDEPPTAGRAIFRQAGQRHDLFALNAAQQRALRNHHFGMVYQNPQLGLNFGWSVSGNIAERLLMSGTDNYAAIRRRAGTLLERMSVPVERMDVRPGTFSGGMQQRVQIARARAPDPPLLFLDEVTTGLDLTVQAKILDLILELQHDLKIAMIVVTHDLGVVRLLTTRTLVMRFGRIVEAGLTDQILEDPQHPYTQALVSSAL